MNATDDLYQLIQSLTKAEKRQFALDAGEGSNYVRLFHAIAAQKVYDEAGLRQSFEGEAFAKNFSVAKAYLYERILHVLRTTQKVTNPEMALRRVLDNLELLYVKGLFDQAHKQIQRALGQARELDLGGLEVEFLKWRRRLINQQSPKDRVEVLERLDVEETDALRRLSEEAALLSVRAQVQSINLQQIDLRLPANVARLSALMEHPLLNMGADRLAFHARISYFQIHATYQRMVGQSGESLGYQKALLQAWEDAPKLKAAFPELYIHALTAFLDGCLRAHRFEGFGESLAILDTLPLEDARLRARAFYLGQHLNLRYAITTGNLDWGILKADAIEEGLVRHGKFLSATVPVTFLYNLAVVHFLALDFPATIKYVNRILNQAHLSVRKDILDATRLLELAAHYELAHADLLESLLRSMDRRLRMQPRAFAFEKILVQGIRKLLDTREGEERGSFEGMRDAFDQMAGATYLAGREEIHFWIQAKIEGKTPGEVMREKVVSSQ